MSLGYIQQKIVEIGKKKGFITTHDLRKYYTPKIIHKEMNKLILKGYFEQPKDLGTCIRWGYVGNIGKESKKNKPLNKHFSSKQKNLGLGPFKEIERAKQEERERVLGVFEKEFQYAEPLTKLLIDNTIKKIRKGEI